MAKKPKNKVRWEDMGLILMFLVILALVLFILFGGSTPVNEGDDENSSVESIDCADYDIPYEYRKVFGYASVNQVRNTCLLNNGTWHESPHILLCDFNQPTTIDCNSVNIVQSRNLCNSMNATYYCDNVNGVHGCDCHHTFVDTGPETVDCEAFTYVLGKDMDICQEHSCSSGETCLWYPFEPNPLLPELDMVPGSCRCVGPGCKFYWEEGQEKCGGGCDEGESCEIVVDLDVEYCECQSGEVECSDSDGGVNPNAFGVCVDDLGPHEDICVGPDVMEEYCGDDGKCYEGLMQCGPPFFCVGGQCLID